MKKLYNYLKVKLCYRTYWKQWVAFIIFLLVIILGSEYADYTTKRVLEYEREKAIERLELAKEKDSIDCLLYTSPSPRDGRISRMPSSA